MLGSRVTVVEDNFLLTFLCFSSPRTDVKIFKTVYIYIYIYKLLFITFRLNFQKLLRTLGRFSIKIIYCLY
jgi:hypothetical protein